MCALSCVTYGSALHNRSLGLFCLFTLPLPSTHVRCRFADPSTPSTTPSSGIVAGDEQENSSKKQSIPRAAGASKTRFLIGQQPGIQQCQFFFCIGYGSFPVEDAEVEEIHRLFETVPIIALV